MSELIGETAEGGATAAIRASETPGKKTVPGTRKPRVAASEAKATRAASKGKKAPNAAAKAKGSRATKAKGARQGSKAGKILDLLKRPGGASLNEIMKATGWQAHLVRGFISGTLGKKMSLTVISTRTGDGECSYSIKI
jgi:hypothetical protein